MGASPPHKPAASKPPVIDYAVPPVRSRASWRHWVDVGGGPWAVGLFTVGCVFVAFSLASWSPTQRALSTIGVLLIFAAQSMYHRNKPGQW